MEFKKSRKFFFIIIWLGALFYVEAQPSSGILIAAASDLKFALDSVITVFKIANPRDVVEVTYGSSGKLFEQISNGAPFDLFFSADLEYPLRLQKKGIAISKIQTYGVGRIVVWSNQINVTAEGINALLNKRTVKIAIANPAHAPYGRRAEEALKYYKIYDRVKNKLVYGENISQAAQFISTGAAEAGIIALSLALSPTMKESGSYYIIPEDAHTPLEQGFAILEHARENSTAIRFQTFVLTNEAMAILKFFGFSKKR